MVSVNHEYLNLREFGELVGLSPERIRQFVIERRIRGAFKSKGRWRIPSDASVLPPSASAYYQRQRPIGCIRQEGYSEWLSWGYFYDPAGERPGRISDDGNECFPKLKSTPEVLALASLLISVEDI